MTGEIKSAIILTLNESGPISVRIIATKISEDVNIRKTTEKSGTIFMAFWNDPSPVPLPPFLRNGGESGTLERRAK